MEESMAMWRGVIPLESTWLMLAFHESRKWATVTELVKHAQTRGVLSE